MGQAASTRRKKRRPRLFFPGLVEIYQTVGRSIVGVDAPLRFELWQDVLGELLAQLHAPLVEGVDAPDGALHKDFVFIQGNQGPRTARSMRGMMTSVDGLLPG